MELITYEAISIAYSECMSVALVIQHAKLMRRVVLSCGLYGPPIFFYVISWMARFSGGKKVIEHKMCCDFLYNVCVPCFSLLEEVSEVWS